MSLKKALGVSSFVLLSSCAPQPKLPEFPQMSFEEKITHHTNDGELSYFEAKDLMKAYEKEQKKGNSEGEQMQLRELSEKLKDELCKEYLLLGESDYYGMYNIKEEISEKYNDQIKNLMLCFDQINTNARNKEILTKLKTKERYTLEDAIFVYHATKNNLETFYLKDGKLVSVGVEKFKGLYNSLNEYCSDIIEEPLGYETPYVSMGLFGAIAHSVGVDPEESSKVLEYNLQEITGKEIKVPEKDLIYPKTYFGVWLGLLAGIMAPALVKSLVMSYTKRKKREKLDDNIGFVNLIIGNAGVDIIHPYIFWGRLFLPVLTEIMVSKTKENVNKE